MKRGKKRSIYLSTSVNACSNPRTVPSRQLKCEWVWYSLSLDVVYFKDESYQEAMPKEADAVKLQILTCMYPA